MLSNIDAITNKIQSTLQLISNQAKNQHPESENATSLQLNISLTIQLLTTLNEPLQPNGKALSQNQPPNPIHESNFVLLFLTLITECQLILTQNQVSCPDQIGEVLSNLIKTIKKLKSIDHQIQLLVQKPPSPSQDSSFGLNRLGVDKLIRSQISWSHLFKLALLPERQSSLDRPAQQDLVDLLTEELINSQQQQTPTFQKNVSEHEHEKIDPSTSSSLPELLFTLYQLEQVQSTLDSPLLVRRILINWAKIQPNQFFCFLNHIICNPQKKINIQKLDQKDPKDLLDQFLTTTPLHEANKFFEQDENNPSNHPFKPEETREKEEDDEDEFDSMSLLIDFITHSPYSIHKIQSTNLLSNLMRYIIHHPIGDQGHVRSPPAKQIIRFKLTIDAVLIILPRLSSLIGSYLPYLLIALARSSDISNLSSFKTNPYSFSPSPSSSSSSSDSSQLPPDHSTEQELKLKEKKVDEEEGEGDHDRVQVDLNSSVLNLFNFLYGIAPCNLIDFLRSPIDFIHSFNLGGVNSDPTSSTNNIGAINPTASNHSPNPVNTSAALPPFGADLEDGFKILESSVVGKIDQLIHVDRLKNFMGPMMEQHKLNKSLILMKSSSVERKEISNRLKFYEAAELIEKCERNLIFYSFDHHHHKHLLKAGGGGGEVLQSSRETLKGDEGDGEGLTPESNETPPSQAEEKYKDEPATGESTEPIPMETSESGKRKHCHHHAKRENRRLQLEINLLKNQLNLELYLKSQHLQQLGSVHKQNINGAGLEAENQNLLRMNKELKKKLKSLNEYKQTNKLKNSKNVQNKLDYLTIIKNKNLSLKDENLKVLTHKFNLLNDLNELEKVLALKSVNFDLLQVEAHNIKNELNLIQPKLIMMEELEKKNCSLSKALLTWDDDLRRFRESRKQIDILRSQWKKFESLVRSTEGENDHLRDQLQTQIELNSRLDVENQYLKERNKRLIDTRRIKIRRDRVATTKDDASKLENLEDVFLKDNDEEQELLKRGNDLGDSKGIDEVSNQRQVDLPIENHELTIENYQDVSKENDQHVSQQENQEIISQLDVDDDDQDIISKEHDENVGKKSIDQDDSKIENDQDISKKENEEDEVGQEIIVDQKSFKSLLNQLENYRQLNRQLNHQLKLHILHLSSSSS